MTDQSFREIQLSGKQLVFLFMASVVLAVVVFLLGVSVGRGVRQETGPGGPASTIADVRPPDTLPPPTTLPPDDQRYDGVLQGNTTPGAAVAPAPETAKPAVTPAAEPPVVAEPAPAASETRPTPPAPSTAKPVPPAAAAIKPVPPATSGWLVQAGAFKSRANADKVVQTLIGKGYSAVVQSGGGLFRVRVGPYAQRADADRAAARIRREEGLSPSVTR